MFGVLKTWLFEVPQNMGSLWVHKKYLNACPPEFSGETLTSESHRTLRGLVHMSLRHLAGQQTGNGEKLTSQLLSFEQLNEFRIASCGARLHGSKLFEQ